MGHRITGFGALARDLADSRHDNLRVDAEMSRVLYQCAPVEARRGCRVAETRRVAPTQ
jgi:hypothetical protein